MGRNSYGYLLKRNTKMYGEKEKAAFCQTEEISNRNRVQRCPHTRVARGAPCTGPGSCSRETIATDRRVVKLYTVDPGARASDCGVETGPVTRHLSYVHGETVRLPARRESIMPWSLSGLYDRAPDRGDSDRTVIQVYIVDSGAQASSLRGRNGPPT